MSRSDRIKQFLAYLSIIPILLLIGYLQSAHADELTKRPAYICFTSKDPDATINACTTIIDRLRARDVEASGLEPIAKRFYYNRAGAFDTKGDNAQVVADLSKAIKLDDHFVSAYVARSIVYGRMGDHGAAITDAEKALEIDPKNSQALNSRAWSLYKLGRANEGYADAIKALDLSPNAADTWDTLGHINEALGHKEEAAFAYKRAILLEPSLQESIDGLKRLGID